MGYKKEYKIWIASLNRLASDFGIDMTFDPENSAWKDCFENGDTPREALEADLEARESLASE